MNSDNFKEVDFGTYCASCVHADKKESEDPCYDCLAEPARQYTHKPSKFEEAPKKPSKEEKRK